jgi:putative DNA primase/helicase
MTKDIFEEARRLISRGLIEHFIPGGKWKGENYNFCSPFRKDEHPSIDMKENGLWVDRVHEEVGGDLIDYLAMRHNISKKEAAEKIIEDSGGTVENKKPSNKDKKKPDPVIPIPEEAFEKLNNRLEQDWSIKKYGAINGGWKWRDNKGVWCCTARHEKGGEKDIIPYYYGTDGKWIQGNPIAEDRPIYRLNELPEVGKVLIVEGEKCADVPVDGYFVTTWIGGTGQVRKTNWKMLADYKDITIWPDNDIPGTKAAAYIKEQLSQARIIKIKGKPDKWDIADAAVDGTDIIKFITEAEYVQGSMDTVQHGNVYKPSGNGGSAPCESNGSPGGPFQHLGYDDQRHYFLPRGSNIVTRIGKGSFNKTKLLELAPLSWWCMEYPDKRGFDVDVAIDTTIRDSELRGMFQTSRIRGSGVWLHDNKLIINNGETTTDEHGNEVSINSKFYYVKSDKRMGDFRGDMATSEQGYNLMKLFIAQGFESEFEALAMLGWTLIAPFGGILKWRPHVWLTGPAKSGKSHILENLIEPLVSPFYHKGTGKTSAPGIYRAIRNTACPILLDEMEPGKNANKETIQKIEEKLELARNASSDFSSTFTLTSMSGSGLTEEFCVRSCFCFASILPYFSGEAIESRIILSRLKNIKTTKSKIEKTVEILKTGIMDNPVIFQRRIFRKLKSIITNIEIVKKIFIEQTGDQRKSDNLAPVFAAIIAIAEDSDIVDIDKIKKLVEIFTNDLKSEKSGSESDEDKLFFEMLDYTIQLSPSEKISIAELILQAANRAERISPEKHDVLQRHGIRMLEIEGNQYLAIASSHSAIKRILSDTMYCNNYNEVLKRHEAKSGAQSVRFAGQAKWAVMLDWMAIKDKYFDDSKQDDESGSLFMNEVASIF